MIAKLLYNSKNASVRLFVRKTQNGETFSALYKIHGGPTAFIIFFIDFYILHAFLPQLTPPSLNGIKVFKGLIQREMEFDVSTTACTEIERKVNYGMFFYAMFF